MKKKKNFIKRIGISLMCFTFFISGCDSNAADNLVKEKVTTDSKLSIEENSIEMPTYDDEDSNTKWNKNKVNKIKLKTNKIKFSGDGAEVDNNQITITKAGTYVIKGKLKDGSIIVDTKDKDVVHLIFNGVTINCSNNAPVYIKSASKTVITLADQTVNTLIDGENYQYLDENTDEPNAALFSKDNLTINGTGKLIVNGNYNNGITSKDELKIAEGNIVVSAADDGILGRDLLAIKGGMITITAKDDGLKSSNTDEDKGNIIIEGGTIDITANGDGIQAENSLLITGGEFNILCGDKDVIYSEDTNQTQMPNMRTKETTTADTETQVSQKGLKASKNIGINNGTFTINTIDDAIHSNGKITISNGSFSIATKDDAIHADNELELNGGTINIIKSYEGLEADNITINGGTISIISSDDGINAASKEESEFSSSHNSQLTINDGQIQINSSADGIDSNGNVNLNGGTVIIFGPTSGGDGAIDYDGQFEIGGGTLFAAGSLGMLQTPSAASAQSYFSIAFDTTQQADTEISLLNQSEDTIFNQIVEKEYQSIIISIPELKEGSQYSFVQNKNTLFNFTFSAQANNLTQTGEIAQNNKENGKNKRGGREAGIQKS